MLMWKIVEASKASVLYIYIDESANGLNPHLVFQKHCSKVNSELSLEL